MGLAIFGTLGMAVYRSRVAASLPPDVPPETAAAAQETLANAVSRVERLPPATGDALLAAARLAFTQGLQLLAAIATVVVAGLVVLAAVMLRDTAWPLVLLHMFNDIVQFLAVGGVSYEQIPPMLIAIKLTYPVLLAIYGLYLVRDAWLPSLRRRLPVPAAQ